MLKLLILIQRESESTEYKSCLMNDLNWNKTLLILLLPKVEYRNENLLIT